MTATEPLVTDFLDYIEKVRQFAPATVNTYMYVLKSFSAVLGERDIQKLTLPEVDNYIALFAADRKLKHSSVNTIRCVLRAFFLYVDRYRNLRMTFDYSMLRQIQAPRARVVYTDVHDLQHMMAKMPTKQDRLMLLTMFSTGMRIGELVKFCVEDLQGDEIRIRGKGAVDRVVPIDGDLADALTGYIREHGIYTGTVFRHQQEHYNLPNHAYSVSGLRNRWKRILGDDYKKPHSLRHGIATGLLMGGMDIRTVQTFLGHSDIRTTQLYTHVTNQHLQESYRSASPTRKLNLTSILDNGSL